jgi:hypothetical protein
VLRTLRPSMHLTRLSERGTKKPPYLFGIGRFFL